MDNDALPVRLYMAVNLEYRFWIKGDIYPTSVLASSKTIIWGWYKSTHEITQVKNMLMYADIYIVNIYHEYNGKQSRWKIDLEISWKNQDLASVLSVGVNGELDPVKAYGCR